MLIFQYNIEIGNYQVLNFSSLEIRDTWQDISATATIILGGLRQTLRESIQIGDPVLIQLGYDGDLRTEFEGYVTAVLPTVPVQIKCEDEAWKLRRGTINRQFPAGSSLKDIVSFLLPGADVSQVQDVKMKMTFKDVSRYKALESLKEIYGLTVYFRNKQPFVGLAFTEEFIQDKIVNYQMTKPADRDHHNVIDSDLEFKRKEDVLIRVSAISILEDNKRIEEEVGDEDGEKHTMHFYNITDADQLKKIAQERIDKMKYDGYEGSILTFGVPFAQHGYTARLSDALYPEREGSYYIDETVITVSDTGGFRREVYLGRKLAEAV